MVMTADVAILNILRGALEDSAAGYAYVAEASDSFGLYAHCDFQAFERPRLAALLPATETASPADDGAGADRCIVNLRIARVHGDATVISQLQRNDARLSHMLQASLVDEGLTGEAARTVRTISNAISDSQAELAILSRTAVRTPGNEARQAA